jgi:hypothetical protein
MTTQVIWPSVEAAFFDFNKPLEALILCLYADIKNYITTGVGNLVDPVELARGLPFRRPDGSRASPEEIEEEWWVVKRDPLAAEEGAARAMEITKLRLTEDDVRVLVKERLEENVQDLVERSFPALSSWPAPVQLAILSMAWAMGSRFSKDFPRFTAAMLRGDFEGAATECTIREVDNPGVKPRNILNRQLFVLGARVHREGLDPSLLKHPPSAVEPPTRPMTPEQAHQVAQALAALALAQMTLNDSVNTLIEDSFRQNRDE